MRTSRNLILLTFLLALTLGASAQRAYGPAQTSDIRATDDIVNGGFETAGGSGWSSFSANGFNLFCVNGTSCVSFSPRTGNGFVWLGGDGVLPADESASITQSLSLSADNIVTLVFYLYRPTALDTPANAEMFSVIFGSSTVFTTYSSASAYSAGYTQVIVDLTPYSADFGLTSNLEFWATDSVGPITSWLIDDISLVVRETSGNLLASSGFESSARAPLPSPWTRANSDGKDKVKCDNPALSLYYAFTGVCAFMFKGSTGENTILTQKRPGSVLTFPGVLEANDRWSLSWWAAGSQINLLTASVKFKVTTACPRGTALSSTFSVSAPPAGAAIRAGAPLYLPRGTGEQLFPCSTTITKIIVKFKNSAPSGKTFLDHVTFIAHQPVGRSQSDALPLPPPAQ